MLLYIHTIIILPLKIMITHAFHLSRRSKEAFTIDSDSDWDLQAMISLLDRATKQTQSMVRCEYGGKNEMISRSGEIEVRSTVRIGIKKKHERELEVADNLGSFVFCLMSVRICVWVLDCRYSK